MVFRSKVDKFMWPLLAITPLACLVVLISGLASGKVGALVTAGIMTVLVVLLYWGLVWPVEYTLGDGELTVRFGAIRQRLPYDQIERVAPTRSILASPALSLDRLALHRPSGLPWMISPEDRERFLDQLARRAPHLVRDGDQLVPS